MFYNLFSELTFKRIFCITCMLYLCFGGTSAIYANFDQTFAASKWQVLLFKMLFWKLVMKTSRKGKV